MTDLHLSPNVPMPELPNDLRARWDVHENGGQHAICVACHRALGWTKADLKSGDWLAMLRAHRCEGMS